nr:fimbria/pilus outer membrane usher protein [Luteibacter sp. Sphag1AF]
MPDSPWKTSLLPALVLGSVAAPAGAASVEAVDASGVELIQFNENFLSSGSSNAKVDLTRFERANAVLPGTYRGDIIVNTSWQSRSDITFVSASDGESVQPCFDVKTLSGFGVDLQAIASDATHAPARPIPAAGTFCGALEDYVPGASALFDVSTQELAINVPQIYMASTARGYVDPSQWDDGINAGVLNYNANVYRSGSQNTSDTSGYVGINASLNLGSWHVMHVGALNWSQRSGRNYQNSSTYLQHDIASVMGQLVVGDTFTPGDMFNSVRVRGMRLYSDPRMLPNSQRGYAPVVRGIAETNAHVVVRQGGYVIYDTNVAPGPFAIDDLYPTGTNGDLNVEVIEADGRVNHIVVPYASIAELLRPGQVQWSVAAGQVTQQNLRETPGLVQATLQRGLSNSVTSYGGITYANGYRSAVVGSAFNTRMGAVSLDVTHASNHAPGNRKTRGWSYRLGYSANVPVTGTNIALGAYRYSTGGFVGLDDAVLLRDASARGPQGADVQRQRSRFDVNINQPLGEDRGQLFLTSSTRDFWAGGGRQIDFSAGYSHRWKSINYSFTAQRSRISDYSVLAPVYDVGGVAPTFRPNRVEGRRDTRFFVTISMPLGTASRSPHLAATFDRAQQGGNSTQLSVSGALGRKASAGYGINLSQNANGNAINANMNYRSPIAQLAAGIGQGRGYRQVSANASGTVVAHSGGFTLTPYSGDTFALVHAPDAAGASVEGVQSAVVDARGYAVVAGLQPYQRNTVSIDPKGSRAGLELKTTTASVAPRARSVVALTYETVSGRALMIDSVLSDGAALPFGAVVYNAEGESVGVVGQGGRVFVRGIDESSGLVVKWGSSADERCRIQLDLPPASDKKKQRDFERFHLPCVKERDSRQWTGRYGPDANWTAMTPVHNGLVATCPSQPQPLMSQRHDEPVKRDVFLSLRTQDL